MLIPIPVIMYALKNKKVNQVKLYLYLKYSTSGHYKVTTDYIFESCKKLSWQSIKTFKNNFTWLVRKGWIAYNSKTHSCRVKSYRQLRNTITFFTRSGVIVEEEDFAQLRPFFYAAAISWCMKYKYWKERQPGRKKGRSRKSCRQQYFQMPNRYMAKVLNLDHSTISRYKKEAVEAGYLSIIHRYEDLDLPDTFIHSLREFHPDESHLFVVHEGKCFRQQSSYITSNINLKTKRIRAP